MVRMCVCWCYHSICVLDVNRHRYLQGNNLNNLTRGAFFGQYNAGDIVTRKNVSSIELPE